MSIVTPLIGGLILYILWAVVDARIAEASRQHFLKYPNVGFSIETGELYLGMTLRVLIPTPVIGIGFGVLAFWRKERGWALPSIGFLLNLVEIALLITHIVVIRYLGYMAW